MVLLFDGPSFAALAAPVLIGNKHGEEMIEEALVWPSVQVQGRCGGMIKGLNLHANDDRYDITADLPGFKPEEIKVELLGRNRIAVTAETNEPSDAKADDADEGRGVRVTSKSHRTFRQVMKLPNDVDKAGASAKVEQAVLSVVVPRRKDIPNGPRMIPVLDAHAEASLGATADGSEAQPAVAAEEETA